MSKKHKKNQSRPATKPEQEDVLNLAKVGETVSEALEAIAEAEKVVAEAEEVVKEMPETTEEQPEENGGESGITSIVDLIKNATGITEEQRKKLLGDAEKLATAEARDKNAKAMVDFNKELETELPKWLEALREKHGVDLKGRRITVLFPKDGEDLSPKLTSSLKGNGGGRTGNGFPSKWGEAELVKDGKTTKHESPSKLAESLNLQIQGARNMVDVFETPRKSGTKEELPKIYDVDAVKGDHFRVTVLSKPKS